VGRGGHARAILQHQGLVVNLPDDATSWQPDAIERPQNASRVPGTLTRLRACAAKAMVIGIGSAALDFDQTEVDAIARDASGQTLNQAGASG
jgi:hypothetical protein